MTAFDFSLLRKDLPSRFKLLAADNERFSVRHIASKRDYLLIKSGETFRLYVINRIIAPEMIEPVYSHKELRPVLVALGIVKGYRTKPLPVPYDPQGRH